MLDWKKLEQSGLAQKRQILGMSYTINSLLLNSISSEFYYFSNIYSVTLPSNFF